jgi:hypothetical protein
MRPSAERLALVAPLIGEVAGSLERMRVSRIALLGVSARLDQQQRGASCAILGTTVCSAPARAGSSFLRRRVVNADVRDRADLSPSTSMIGWRGRALLMRSETDAGAVPAKLSATASRASWSSARNDRRHRQFRQAARGRSRLGRPAQAQMPPGDNHRGRRSAGAGPAPGSDQSRGSE